MCVDPPRRRCQGGAHRESQALEAERALADRVAELSGSDETPVREQQAMENAAYFLRLLRKTSATPNTSYEPSSPPQFPRSNYADELKRFVFPNCASFTYLSVSHGYLQ